MKKICCLYVLLLITIVSCSKNSTGNDIVKDCSSVDASDIIPDTNIQEDLTSSDTDAAAQDTRIYTISRILPGPDETGYNPGLADKALEFDRGFWALHASVCGLDCEAFISADDTAGKTLIKNFITESKSWDFAADTGKQLSDVLTGWTSIPGLYAGMGIGADAFKYALLRDGDAAKKDVDRARQHLLSDLDIMHIAFEITGVRGVVARGLAKKGLPGDAGNINPLPLFDKNGNPLPEKKNNGTWRADNSGKYPDYYWVDSISRDYLMGWAFAVGTVSEVIRDDPTIPDTVKIRLAKDASDVVWSLRQVRKSGYDLEIMDADGRTTLNGYLNEHSFDQGMYLPKVNNGFYALMSLGIVGAFTYASQDPDNREYLYDELIKKRHLPQLVRNNSSVFIDMGRKTSFSAYNMAFTSAFMAIRYINDPEVRNTLRESLKDCIYNIPGHKHQPIEQHQAWYDIVYAAAQSGDNAFSGPDAPADPLAVKKVIQALNDFPTTPDWDEPRENCDQDEITSKNCTLNDGTQVKVLGNVGRNNDLICEQVIPVAVRVPSNFHWRSNPYIPNGGGNGSVLLAGVDFRVAYWTARYVSEKIVVTNNAK